MGETKEVECSHGSDSYRPCPYFLSNFPHYEHREDNLSVHICVIILFIVQPPLPFKITDSNDVQ